MALNQHHAPKFYADYSMTEYQTNLWQYLHENPDCKHMLQDFQAQNENDYKIMLLCHTGTKLMSDSDRLYIQ